MKTIKMLVFDIDGVITDGKRYIGGGVPEMKSVSLKDLDAIHQLRAGGVQVGCVSGEDTEFSRYFVRQTPLDFARLGCKDKGAALRDLAEQQGLSAGEICYIGDGKYDIAALELAGWALCPADAIAEVKAVSDRVLTRRGGEGCIAEIYTLLQEWPGRSGDTGQARSATLVRRMREHRSVLENLMGDEERMAGIGAAAGMIVDCYRRRHRLFLCGNGGSAADAQHLAGELVGRFYLERRALAAEALTANTSILTSLANDYDYSMVFARQVEAKAAGGDVLIGITTSGTSKNIRLAFEKAKELGVKTILMTGDIAKDAAVLPFTDCLLSVPSRDTPRIQEMHILMGHIICELVEREVTEDQI